MVIIIIVGSNPTGAWIFVCCECCVLSGRGLCDGLITRPEQPYRLWCVVVCDLETSWMRRPWPTGGCCAKNKKKGLRPLACWDRGFESHRGAWLSVCCYCRVLSGTGLCDELIIRPEQSYRLCCVVVCDLETSWMRRPWPTGGWGGCRAKKKQTNKQSLK